MKHLPSVVVVTGELDVSTSARWQEEVDTAGRDSAAVVLDLSAVPFVDSAGVRTLFRMLRGAESQGTRLVVVAPRNGPVHRLLDILDLGSVAPVFETRKQALGATSWQRMSKAG